MKKANKLIILFCITLFLNCVKNESISNNQNQQNAECQKADSVMILHLKEMKDYIDEFKKLSKNEGVISHGNNSILKSILFLSENTGIHYHSLFNSFSGSGYENLDDAIDNYNKWNDWYQRNKGKLFWNEKSQRIEIITK